VYLGVGAGTPVFRGVIDSSRSVLRNGRVQFLAECVYSHLRRRSTGVRRSLISYNENIPSRTFAIVGSQQFREANPYVKYKRQFENWTPFQILDFFVQSYMEPWFMERIRFHVDPAANVMRTYDVPVFKWIVDESGPEP